MRFALSMLLMLAIASESQAQTGVTRRAYALVGGQLARLEARLSGDAKKVSVSSEADLRTALLEHIHCTGVELPADTAVDWHAGAGELIVRTTDDRHSRLGRALSSPEDWQIFVTASLVAFSPADVEALARASASAAPSKEELMRLWRQGRGTLVQSGSFLTPSGEAGAISSGSEMVYASSYDVVQLSGPTNEPPFKGGSSRFIPKGFVQAIVPEFERRNAGVTIQVTPRVRPDLSTIEISVMPELTGLPVWRETTVATVARDGKVEAVKMDVPKVHRQSLQTRLLIRDGATMVLGGMPSEQNDQRTYLFISTRLVDAEGKSLLEHDFKGRLLE